ncbi:MAG: hypothetical protein J5924_05290 [Bacteroidaceae bacterium]|nr:hypothetical protein [Bacteroidaceae bacterium]
MKVKFFLFLILMGMSASAYAQQNDTNEYRIAVKELIKNNKDTKSCFVLLMAGTQLEGRYGDHLWVLLWFEDNPEVKMRLNKAYYESQFVDDQTDIFIENCQGKITLSDVKQLTSDLPVIKNIASFTENKAQILQEFEKYLRPYLHDEFQGFEEPDCSNSYKQLCEEFYKMLDMQKAFDKDMKVDMGQPVYARYKREVKTYYMENEKAFFLRVCCENLSEQDMKACVEYLSEQPNLYQEIVKISDQKKQDIAKMCNNKFFEWMEKNEPGMYKALLEWEKEFGK